MLGSAVFCALTSVASGLSCFDTHKIGVAWNQVDFSVQSRDPKGVDYVVGPKFDIDGPTHRNMNFVGSREHLSRTVVQVLDLPPPLMTCDENLGFRRMVMIPVNGKCRQKLETPHENDGKDDERYEESSDCNPCLASPDINGRMFSKGTGPPFEGPSNQHPHDERDYQKKDCHEP